MNTLTAPAPQQVPHPLVAGRYQLMAELGKGNFSRVWQAYDVHEHRMVALKRLRQSGLAAPLRGTARQAFRREAAILPHLSHPRIPRLHEASLDGSLWYLAIEYIEGETLERYLKRLRVLPLQDVLTLGLQLCEVLTYLHSTHPSKPPIKFRDLKPANVMRKPDGQIVLIDFGLACPHTSDIDPVAQGTRGYASPEQYADRWGRGTTTPQSDIYSLGVLFHHLLSGEDPTRKPASEQFTFSPISQAPPAFVDLVTSMIQYHPVQRIGSIAEVQARLHDIQREENHP